MVPFSSGAASFVSPSANNSMVELLPLYRMTALMVVSLMLSALPSCRDWTTRVPAPTSDDLCPNGVGLLQVLYTIIEMQLAIPQREAIPSGHCGAFFGRPVGSK